MLIFADRHHDGLARSLRLMAKRIGATIYFPIGLDWFDKGFWDIAKPYGNARDTVRQYLDLDQRYTPVDGTPPLNAIKSTSPQCYEIEDKAHGDTLQSITFDQFLSMDIDVIIASIPDHAVTYKRLRDQYKPKARLVFQMGNMFNEVHDLIREGQISNLLASVRAFSSPVHSVFYHQEVDQSVFKFANPAVAESKISSFVIGLPNEQVFLDLKKELPDYELTAYASKYAPFVQTTKEMADIMAHSKFGLHVKPRGDGFGHVLYSWAFMGRPIITNFSDYADKLANEILIDGVTAINLDGRSPPDVADIIRGLGRRRNYYTMCDSMKYLVNSHVNYDGEAQQLQKFFSSLK